MHGLDEYDSEARWYYPAIMRTTTMDPLCEKYYSISPYAWCGNNPVNLVDPDGRDVAILLAAFSVAGMGHMAILIQDKDEEWHLYSKNGEGVEGISASAATPNDLGEIQAASVSEFLNNPNDNTVEHDGKGRFPYYTAAIIIHTTKEQDNIIREGVIMKINEEYNFFNNNCTEAVQKGLQDAGFKVTTQMIPAKSFAEILSTIPNINYVTPKVKE